MQGFCWLGKIFFELCLIFGAISSAGLYDRVAKIVVFIAAARVKFPLHMKIQHLDDVCACSPAKCDGVDNFYQSYWDISKQLGVELADPKDPDKAFAPRTEGLVLGIDYDTSNMTWRLREDKMFGILNLIREVRDGGDGEVHHPKVVDLHPLWQPVFFVFLAVVLAGPGVEVGLGLEVDGLMLLVVLVADIHLDEVRGGV